MPLPIAAALIAGGSSLLGSGLGAWSTSVNNRKSREWNEEMYALQRKHAIQDWEMQNAYNSPAAQMQRLKDAGLNPNMVYGTGAEATAKSLPNKASVEGWNPSPVIQGDELGRSAMVSMDAFYNTAVREVQIDNLKAELEIKRQDALLKASELVGKNVTNETKKFDFQMKNTLKEISIEYQKEMLREKFIKNQVSLDENERRTALTASNIAQAAERILLMRAQVATSEEERKRIRAQIANINADTELKKMDLRLGRNSPWYVRAVDQLVKGMSPKEVKEKVVNNMFGGTEEMSWYDRLLGNYKKYNLKPW